MTEKLVTQIMELSYMIDGINIALERAREIRERMVLDGSQLSHLGLEALIEILRKDKSELSDSMKKLQKEIT